MCLSTWRCVCSLQSILVRYSSACVSKGWWSYLTCAYCGVLVHVRLQVRAGRP